jgi:hypothetical protein
LAVSRLSPSSEKPTLLWQDLLADLFEDLGRVPRAVLEVEDHVIDPGRAQRVKKAENDITAAAKAQVDGRRQSSPNRPVAGGNAKDEVAALEPVKRSRRLGGMQGVAQGKHDRTGGECDSLRLRCNPTEIDPRIVNLPDITEVRIAQRHIPKPQRSKVQLSSPKSQALLIVHRWLVALERLDREEYAQGQSARREQALKALSLTRAGRPVRHQHAGHRYSPLKTAAARAYLHEFSRYHFVHVAPGPGFPRLKRANQGMTRSLKMLGGMPVRGRVTAADVPAGEAHPQVDPAIADLDTVLAKILIRRSDLDLIKVSAFWYHRMFH